MSFSDTQKHTGRRAQNIVVDQMHLHMCTSAGGGSCCGARGRDTICCVFSSVKPPSMVLTLPHHRNELAAVHPPPPHPPEPREEPVPLELLVPRHPSLGLLCRRHRGDGRLTPTSPAGRPGRRALRRLRLALWRVLRRARRVLAPRSRRQDRRELLRSNQRGRANRPDAARLDLTASASSVSGGSAARTHCSASLSK